MTKSQYGKHDQKYISYLRGNAGANGQQAKSGEKQERIVAIEQSRSEGL
jgi:hypothetical protein